MATSATTEAADPSTDKPPRCTHWIPLSLWMFVAILFALTLFSVFHCHRRSVAISEVQRRASSVNIITEGGPNPPVPFGLGRWLPAFAEVQCVEYFSRPATDDDLKVFGILSEVTVLNLENTQVTDAGLGDLASLRSLQWLRLDGTRVTDAGIEKIASLNLPYLEILDLSGTDITDAGLVHLRRLKSVHYVNLTGTHVSDRGVAELQRALPGLKIEK